MAGFIIGKSCLSALLLLLVRGAASQASCDVVLPDDTVVPVSTLNIPALPTVSVIDAWLKPEQGE